MKNRITLFLALFLVAVSVVSAPVLAGDPVAGKATADQICQTCHGLDGVGIMPMVANLTGQQELYLIAQLEAYKSGKRQHEQMSIISSMLSAEDIENVAAWYSSIKVTFEVPE